MRLHEMEKLANFYIVDLIDILDENCQIVIPEKPIHGLRHTEVTKEDFESIANFGKIIMNYRRMRKLSEDL